jgi:hypothetical protein
MPMFLGMPGYAAMSGFMVDPPNVAKIKVIMIIRKTVYTTFGRDFPNFQKALEYREGLVEKFLRECPGFLDIPLSQRMEFVSSILDRRKYLRDLLNYSDCEDRDDDS